MCESNSIIYYCMTLDVLFNVFVPVFLCKKVLLIFLHDTKSIFIIYSPYFEIFRHLVVS